MLTCTLAIAPCQHCPQAQLLRAPRLGSLVGTSDTEGPIAMLASELSLAPDRCGLVDRSIWCCRDHLRQGALGCGSPPHRLSGVTSSRMMSVFGASPLTVTESWPHWPASPATSRTGTCASRCSFGEFAHPCLVRLGSERGRRMSRPATGPSIASRTSHVLTSRGQRHWGLRPPKPSTGCGRRPLCGVIGCSHP